jgi:hypothetical protein
LSLAPVLFHLFMRRVLPAELAELISLQTIRIVFLILGGRIVPLFADRTRHVDDLSHCLNSRAVSPQLSAHCWG